jgi:DNA-binding NarL/FixJ family response regulator
LWLSWRGKPGVCPDAAASAACDDVPVPCTVLIVDDHAGFRLFARALLEAEGFAVVGEAEDAVSALAAAARLRPRVVLLDVELPGTDGFGVAEQLARAAEAPAVVLISGRDISSYRRRLAGSPARGFIAKSELSGTALHALVC